MTRNSPKAAAAGGSDRQLPHVVAVSGSVSDLRARLTSFIVLLVTQHMHALASSGEPCDLWGGGGGGGGVARCCRLCDLNAGCENTRGYAASRRSPHRYLQRFHKSRRAGQAR